jgi:hypothetical protein
MSNLPFDFVSIVRSVSPEGSDRSNIDMWLSP